MNVGELRERITIQRPTTSVDTLGVTTTTLSNVLTLWASVLPVTSIEQEQNFEVSESKTFRILIRYYADLRTTDVLQWRGHVLHIGSILPDALRTQQEVLAYE